MICWSCRGEMPDAAIFCPHCEAKAEETPTAEEVAAVRNVLASMNAEMLNAIQDAIETSTSGEDFVNRVIVGECPKCGSSNTGDCESVPDIEAVELGRCLDCGQFWCIYCGELLRAERLLDHDCPVLDEMDFED